MYMRPLYMPKQQIPGQVICRSYLRGRQKAGLGNAWPLYARMLACSDMLRSIKEKPINAGLTVIDLPAAIPSSITSDYTCQTLSLLVSTH